MIGLLKTRNLTNAAQGDAAMWAEHGERYLTAWLAGVRRYIPDPKEIVVLTDLSEDIQGVRREPLTTNAPAFFAKLEAFRVGEGRCAYCDLDTVFCGELSALCSLPADPLVMMDDRNVPRLPNGSVILFDADRCRGIWETYQRNPEWYHRHYVHRDADYSHAYDQAFVAEWVREQTGRDVALFQDALPHDYCLNAFSELPSATDWSETRLIFGCGMQAKMHRMTHPAIREHWAA